MKLSAVILLVGLLSVPLVLFGQFLWVRRPDFRRRRARLLQAALVLFPLLAVAHCEAKRIEAPPEAEPRLITTLPADPHGDAPPPPPPPPPPVERPEDCPPATHFRGSLCLDANDRIVPASPRRPPAQ